MTILKNAADVTLSALCHSATADANNIDNNPPADIVRHMETITIPALRDLLDLVDCPLTLTSGYRSIELDNIVSTGKRHAHTTGATVNLKPPANWPLDEFAAVVWNSAIPIIMMIVETGWLHLEFATGAIRRLALDARLGNGAYLTWSGKDPRIMLAENRARKAAQEKTT